MAIRYIDPLKDPGRLLLTVEKPARYTGGEYGRRAKRDAPFQMLIAFPDLYEIGMSNQALRILYNRLNRIDGISCDRAFAPAPDFEKLLRERALPLYGLDTGISLRDLDLLMFTLGYELGITGVLAMLDLSSIPLRSDERAEEHPVVIMGGPCVSNPLPYARFIDAFWIGEAEAGFFDLAGELMEMKKAGQGRAALLGRLRSHPSVWSPGKTGVRRAVDREFASRPPDAAIFPVAGMKTVQHHGAVEIMRGCPNGCRFCHAGYWYRPMRQKSAETVRAEADAFINQGGYREISLSSLSTGDYLFIDELVESLNRDYEDRYVSFQLPSLKISTFSLPLLEKVSLTRKSGLTFAVETPADRRQRGINKTVSRDGVAAILREARKNGWRGAKFYFMIGLPPGAGEKEGEREEEEIVDFVLDIARRTGMNFNVTVGIFIPKPHTPYQWSAQLNGDEGRRKLDFIRTALKSRGHRTGIQDPFISTLEGVLSRGDERVGELVEKAYRAGCRLDAWSEYLRKDLWEAILAENRALVGETLGAKIEGGPLPWDFVDPGVSTVFLKREFSKCLSEENTSPCIEKCNHNCGVCDNETRIVNNIIHNDNIHRQKSVKNFQAGDPATYRILLSFTKQGPAVFQSHLSLMEIFSMAMIRAGIPARYSGGFNPLPRLEIAAPLSVGIAAAGEIAGVDMEHFFAAEDFKRALEGKLPEGIVLVEARNVFIPGGEKKHSLSSLLWGFGYRPPGKPGGVDLVKAADEKGYRLQTFPAFSLNDDGGSPAYPERLSVLAKFPGKEEEPGESYFTVYSRLYG